MVTLYAWANSLSFTSHLDHTWVTTYDLRTHRYGTLAEVVDAGQHCWLCWGEFHPNGHSSSVPDGFLLDCAGNFDFARCLVTPEVSSQNDRGARGTIFEYAIDGVCQQLANQVLWGASGAQHAPPIVSRARGYWISSFLYGDYGRTEHAWKSKIAGCSNAMAGKGMPEGLPDHLLARARKVLAGDREAIDAIARQRAEHRQVVLDALAVGDPSAEQINAANRERLLELQGRIGREKFVRVFGVTAEDAPDVVDPAMFAASRGQLGA